jgi:hypothetical protein
MVWYHFFDFSIVSSSSVLVGRDRRHLVTLLLIEAKHQRHQQMNVEKQSGLENLQQ